MIYFTGEYGVDPEGNVNTVLTELKVRLQALLGDRLSHLVLYGSRARGDYDRNSDIDIAVIVKNLDRETKNSIFKTVADIELTYLTPLSTLILSEEVYDDLLRRERRIALDIERESVPL